MHTPIKRSKKFTVVKLGYGMAIKTIDSDGITH